MARLAREMAYRVNEFCTSPILPILREIEMEWSLNTENWDTEYWLPILTRSNYNITKRTINGRSCIQFTTISYTKVSRINRLTVVYWRIFEHKGEGSRGVFKVCKGFTEIVENLKWVAWGLDVDTGSGRTSINRVCISLFPYLIYVIAINFVLHV